MPPWSAATYKFGTNSREPLGRAADIAWIALPVLVRFAAAFPGPRRCVVTRLTTILCGLCAAFTLAVADARAEKRVALVIGNGAYQNAAPLAGPAKDATAIADLLRRTGFDVVETKVDLGNLELKRVARDFGTAAQGADIAVIYFAGHGIDVNGTNYLLPVDAKLANDFDVEDEALSLDRVIRAIEPAKRLRLVIVDASRDNVFVRTMKRTVSADKVNVGLAGVEPILPDTVIALSAKPGATVDDRQGELSPFTTALLNNLTVSGRDLRSSLERVRDEVMKATANRQEPLVVASLGSTTVELAVDANRLPSSTRQISVLPNPQAETQLVADPQRDYEAAERINTVAAWDAFLSVHPAGFYASLARSQRDKLAPQPVPAAQAPQQVAVLPQTNNVEPQPQQDLPAIARELQAELKRVGCDPGATDGNWSTRSRAAMDEFNRRAGVDIDSRTATVTALEFVRLQRGRICPLSCGRGQRADGDRCVAIPAAPKAPKQAARPPAQRKAEPPARRAPPPKQAVRRERPAPVRAPTDREIFGGGRSAPPLSIGIGRGGIGIGMGF
jgi:hypothetical protein